MRLFLVALLSAVSVATAGVVAQDKPNLSGKWIFDHDETPNEAKAYSFTGASGARVQGRVTEFVFQNGNLGPAFTLTQDANTLKLERTLADGSVYATTYVLDGSEASHRKPDINGQPGPAWTSRSSWQGATLIISSFEDSFTVQMTGGKMEKYPYQSERTLKLSLTPDGKLVSESASKTPSGDWTPGTRSIYKKG
jgi:hypothetical protein